MPTYDYVCRACEHRFEHFQSMQEPALRKCPECGRSQLERLIGSGAGILFKGSGFYETDYKRKSPPPSSDGAGSGGAKDAGSKDAGSKDAGSKDAGPKPPESKPAGPAPGSAPSSSGPQPGCRSKDA